VENLLPIICYYRGAANLNNFRLNLVAFVCSHDYAIQHRVQFNFQLNADNAAVYDTVIFAGPPPMKQRLWPRHCVQDTWGSELHKDLKVCLIGSIKKLLGLCSLNSI
jgi:hypothetical protein